MVHALHAQAKLPAYFIGEGTIKDPDLYRKFLSEEPNAEINAALTDPEISTQLTELGGTELAGTPAYLGKFIVDETEKWAKVIKRISK